MPEREFFINAIQMVEVDGDRNIPTALLYRPDGSVAFGNEALAEAADVKLINEDFKIDLGRYAPTVQSKRRFKTAVGTEKSAAQIADDYLYEVQKIAKRWLNNHGINECKNLVVAEPLSMHTEEVSPDWLANYRNALRRLLEGKTIFSPTGVTVRFIPEPFAAFQYYRYGIRHPLVSQRTQMNIMVIDFGGGTCDMCIIETTREGDISGGGRNKRPLAGKSIPVGGFAINRALAEFLIRKLSPTAQDGQLKTAFREYREWIEGRHALEALDIRYRRFIERFHDLVHRVETTKIALSRSVSDWSLDSEPRFSVSVSVPTDPFSERTTTSAVSISVSDFREIFVNKIYQPYLKPFFTERLKVGMEVVENAPVSVILLSGGSANIGWLQGLMREDFGEMLHGAPFVQISDYQQVVAQGLAVDCAREFATGSSDFKGITYNPLFLLLNPDNVGCEPRQFQPKTTELPEVKSRPGLLLPTASLLASFVDRPMQWKVRLGKAPKHRLDYYFLQSSMDPNDVKNLQNVEETTLHTPPNCEFDSFLQTQLTIRPDGTAIPKFTYRSAGGSGREFAKEGRSFFVDMTDASGGGGEAYIGLDFGTSNTAVSYIDRTWVNLIETRAKESSWRELGELVDLLPSPLAIPLARYIGDVRDSSPVPPGFSFLEAALCLLAYVAYSDYCATPRRGITRFMKGFPHRSSSYSWHLLQSVLGQPNGERVTHQALSRLLERKNQQMLDDITRNWAETRHEVSLAENNAVLASVRLLANVAHAVFSRHRFGFFQGVQKERFASRYTGRFRIAHGKPPYSGFVPYGGTLAFSEAEAVLADIENGHVLPLAPLVFWYPCSSHREAENGHCYLLDLCREQGGATTARYKAAGFSCSLEVSSKHAEMVALLDLLQSMRTADPQSSKHENLRFELASHAGG